MMKKITADAFLQFRFVSDPGFSPDGSKAAFVVQTPALRANTYKSNLWMLDVKTKALTQLTALGDAKAYTWTPEGKLLFSALRCPARKEKVQNGEELTIYYELDPKGGEAVEAFCVPHKVTGLKVLDADNYILTVNHDNNRPDFSGLEGEEKAKAIKAYAKPQYETFEEQPFWSNGRGFTSGLRRQVWHYVRSTNTMTQITADWFDTQSVCVKDGKVLIVGAEWEKKQVSQPAVLLWTPAEGLKTVRKQGKGRIGMAQLLNDTTAVITMNDYGCSVKNYVNYPDFYALSLNTGRVRKIADWDGNTGSSVGSDSKKGSGASVRVKGSKVYFSSTKGGDSFLYELNTKGGAISGPLTPAGTVESFDVSGNHTLVCGLRDMKLAELYLDGEQVTHFNDEFLAEHEVRKPEAHTFVNKDGVEIQGWCITPADYDPAKKYPAILDIHGGPRTAYGPVFFHEMQVWAAQGYFVFFCNPRGSDGRGAEFGNITGKYGTIDYEDIMAFTDEMLKKYPAIDESKVGVTGGSYGGFMTNWIIGHTTRFAAAATQRSIANWIAFEHTSDIGHTFTKNNHGTITRENVDYLWDISPLKYVRNVKTPTLVIHSDEDYRCWMVEGLSLFTALKMHGVPSKMCLFKGENHELSRGGKPRARLRRLEEITGWMDQYLK